VDQIFQDHDYLVVIKPEALAAHNGFPERSSLQVTIDPNIGWGIVGGEKFFFNEGVEQPF
jgi:hypothetical protein